MSESANRHLDSYMLKIIQKQLDTKIIKLSSIFALLYFLLFNTAMLLHKFGYSKADNFKAILELTKDSICVYALLFILFFGLTINRLLFIIVTPVLFFTGALASYYLYFFKITPTISVIGSVFNTNLNESYESASLRLLLWLTFSLFICIYTITHFKLGNTKLFLTKILSAICLLFTLNIIIFIPYTVLDGYFPIQYLHNTYLYFSSCYAH